MNVSSRNNRKEEFQPLRPIPARIRPLISHNNQSTTFLRYYDKKNRRILLLHDNRVFYFGNPNNPNIDYDELFDQYSNCLQNLLTTPKYRLISIIYALYQLADYAIFITLIVGTIITWKFDYLYYILSCVIMMEIFLDIVNFMTRIWLLTRLHVVIGAIFYISYGSVLYELKAYLFLCFLLARLLIFLCEILTDIGLDYEIHNDLSMEDNKNGCTRGGFLCGLNVETEEQKIKNLDELKNDYLGSISAWWIRSAFGDVYEEDKYVHQTSRIILYLMIALVAIISMPLILIILTLKSFLTCCEAFCADNSRDGRNYYCQDELCYL